MKKGGGSESTIIIGPSKSVLVYALHSLEYVLGLARFRVFVPNFNKGLKLLNYILYISQRGITESWHMKRPIYTKFNILILSVTIKNSINRFTGDGTSHIREICKLGC